MLFAGQGGRPAPRLAPIQQVKGRFPVEGTVNVLIPIVLQAFVAGAVAGAASQQLPGLGQKRLRKGLAGAVKPGISLRVL